MTAQRYPTRFRGAEQRGRRLGRPLRLAARVGELDEDLMSRIGEGMLTRDELGARLADAMRLRAGEPGRVTMDDFRTALNDGLAAVDDPAPALVEFFETASRVPDWVDWDLLASLPINQTDQAATLGLFDAVVLLGVRALGVPVSRADSRRSCTCGGTSAG